jgi:tRNA-specific 2-thiouridylase
VNEKLLIGMSGGVDSTVAAILLQQQGYDVVGVYMKLHDNDAYHDENFAKAQRVGEYLGIPVHFYDISEQFQRDVVDYFVQSYREGLTPNPCVVCNRTIKFGAMVEFADSLGIDKVATGHYLRSDGRYIHMAEDKSKDQSYFLAEVEPSVIPRLVFPLGAMLKSKVVELAANIPVLQDISAQKESSEICFVEDDDYTKVLSKYIDVDQPGEVLDIEGNTVGTHKGYAHYTIGKRRGFTVDGAHDPHYVLSLDSQHNRITVGTREKLQEYEFGLDQINLFDDLHDFTCTLKVRYRTQAIPAHVTVQGKQGFAKLQEPVFGLARGQFAVFYDGERLLGGGMITPLFTF